MGRLDLRSALAWAAGLGLAFVLIYGGINALTALRDGVASFHFDWETRIPFVQAAIAPYWSLDLLFVGAFFIPRDPAALRRLGARVGFAIGVSALGFLLFPLEFAFARPAVDGWSAPLFELLALDRPYNQAPSLHVSLAMIIGALYCRASRGWARAALAGWFVLIALSTVLVYQHHVVDLAAGAAVGLLAFHAFPDGHSCRHGRGQWRLGLRYLGLSLVLAGLAQLARPWGLILLYPALSLLLVGCAYLGGHPGFLAKRGGRIPRRSWLLYAPYLLGTCNSWRWHRRHGPAWQAVTPSILLGRRLHERETRPLLDAGVDQVLDLCPELKAPPSLAGLPGYRHLPLLDLTVPAPEQLAAAVAVLGEQRRRGRVYVHCALGYLRSACVVGAWLVDRGHSVEVVMERLRRLRPALRTDLVEQALRGYADYRRIQPAAPLAAAA